MRQMHNYVALDNNATIETPPDSYEPDKIGNISLEQLQEQRNNEIPQPIKKYSYLDINKILDYK